MTVNGQCRQATYRDAETNEPADKCYYHKKVAVGLIKPLDEYESWEDE